MSDLGIFNPDLYAKGDPWKSGLPLDLFAELPRTAPAIGSRSSRSPCSSMGFRGR